MAHEMGHYLACVHYDVDATLPFFLPSPVPVTGTFGAFKAKAAESLYKGCEAKDEKTVVLSVTRPTSGFPTFLSLDSLSMQSPKAMDAGKANDVVAVCHLTKTCLTS